MGIVEVYGLRHDVQKREYMWTGPSGGKVVSRLIDGVVLVGVQP